MIKLFDFKFLILLGLTLVVYFMYKEIDYQRERIHQCEIQIKALLETNPNQFHNEDTPQIINQEAPINSKNSRPQLQYPKQKKQVTIKEQNIPVSKNILIQEENVNVQEQTGPIQQQTEIQVQTGPIQVQNGLIQETTKNLVLNLPKNMINKSKVVSTETTEVETDEKLIETENKHIEIYSNDNENCMETSISDSLINGNNILLQKSSSDTSETSEQQGNNFQYNLESNTNNEKEEIEEKEESENSKEESNSDDIDYDVNISEDSKEIAKKENSDIKKISKSSKTSKSSKSSKQELDEVLNDLKIEISNDMINDAVSSKSVKLDLPGLMKMKVPELHNLALKENITLEKKINGVSKKKTKQELAEEILAKKNI